MLTQEQKRRRHHKTHNRHRGDYPCWYCGKEEATCRQKLKFATKDECLAKVREFNSAHTYEVTAYFCVLYCEQWHFHTNRSKGSPPAPRTVAGRNFSNGSRVTDKIVESALGTVLMECQHCPGLIVRWDEGPATHESWLTLVSAEPVTGPGAQRDPVPLARRSTDAETAEESNGTDLRDQM